MKWLLWPPTEVLQDAWQNLWEHPMARYAAEKWTDRYCWSAWFTSLNFSAFFAQNKKIRRVKPVKPKTKNSTGPWCFADATCLSWKPKIHGFLRVAVAVGICLKKKQIQKMDHFFHLRKQLEVMKETTWFVDEDGNKDREATLVISAICHGWMHEILPEMIYL